MEKSETQAECACLLRPTSKRSAMLPSSLPPPSYTYALVEGFSVATPSFLSPPPHCSHLTAEPTMSPQIPLLEFGTEIYFSFLLMGGTHHNFPPSSGEGEKNCSRTFLLWACRRMTLSGRRKNGHLSRVDPQVTSDEPLPSSRACCRYGYGHKETGLREKMGIEISFPPVLLPGHASLFRRVRLPCQFGTRCCFVPVAGELLS